MLLSRPELPMVVPMTNSTTTPLALLHDSRRIATSVRVDAAGGQLLEVETTRLVLEWQGSDLVMRFEGRRVSALTPSKATGPRRRMLPM